MFKQFVKIILLYIRNKRKNIKSFSQFISLKAIIDKNCNIQKDTEIDANSKIGKYTYIGKYCYLTKVTIGNYCSIANNISIGQGEHDISNISTSSFFYDDAYEQLTQKECRIGNDVWIGVDSIILRGVSIGNGAVVGANSVVTKDVPPFSIVVGSPARVIKYRFNKDKIINIENSEWWNHDIEEATKVINKLELENK